MVDLIWDVSTVHGSLAKSLTTLLHPVLAAQDIRSDAEVGIGFKVGERKAVRIMPCGLEFKVVRSVMAKVL